jgi:hypothetical protein
VVVVVVATIAGGGVEVVSVVEGFGAVWPTAI